MQTLAMATFQIEISELWKCGDFTYLISTKNHIYSSHYTTKNTSKTREIQ